MGINTHASLHNLGLLHSNAIIIRNLIQHLLYQIFFLVLHDDIFTFCVYLFALCSLKNNINLFTFLLHLSFCAPRQRDGGVGLVFLIHIQMPFLLHYSFIQLADIAKCLVFMIFTFDLLPSYSPWMFVNFHIYFVNYPAALF